MKRIFRFLATCFFAISFITNSFSQQCSDCRYIAPIFDSITIQTVHFGSAVKINGDTQQLYMDIYEPYGDTATNRPVVMFAFGGGFVQGSKNDWYVREVCRHYTKAGYVCAAMDYRVGINYLEIVQLQHMRIFFRPMQDYRGAVQYLKWDFAENGNNFRIDTSMIFAGGASAGAITALMMQYCDKPTEIAEMGNISALNALGGFYSTSGFHQNYSWSCAATVNVAGALINANWIEPNDAPIMSAHGDADQVVPYGYGPLGGGALGNIFDLQGSYVVDSIARSKGVCSYLYTMEGRDHPSESMGIEYFYSIVYRIMLRMQAVRNNQSFCCPLKVDITPGDTLYYGTNTLPTELTAVVTNDNGNSSLHWCTMPCQLSSTANSITVIPDSTLKYVAATVSEGGCLSGDLYFIFDSLFMPSAIGSIDELSFSAYPQPASNFIYVTADLGEHKNKTGAIVLTNVVGQQVYKQTFDVLNTKSQLAIDVRELPAGNYLLSILLNGLKVGTKRISVVH